MVFGISFLNLSSFAFISLGQVLFCEEVFLNCVHFLSHQPIYSLRIEFMLKG